MDENFAFTANSGDLNVLDTKTFIFEASKGLVYKINNLTLIFSFLQDETQDDVLSPVSVDTETNTLAYTFKGKLPVLPTYTYKKEPSLIGVIGKQNIYITYKFSVFDQNDTDMMELSITTFSKPLESKVGDPEDSSDGDEKTIEEAKNGKEA